MLRALIYGLTILHLGPATAFAVLAFGCDPSQPLLDVVCRKDSFTVFAAITLVVWAALGGVAAVMLARQRGV